MATPLLLSTQFLILQPFQLFWRAKCISTPTNFKPLNSMLKHPQIIRKNPSKRLYNDDLILKTRAIISCVECRNFEDALQLFDEMPKRDTFVYNVIIRGLVDVGSYEEAIGYYYSMRFDGVRPDNLTYPFVIKACSFLLTVCEGHKVHANVIKSGLSGDVYVCNALISMYAKVGCIEFAERLFGGMVVKDLASWNSMISGCVSVGDGCGALMYFRKMQDFGMRVDRFSIIGALGACSVECFLGKGKEIHCYVVKTGLEMDEMVQTAVVDMYCKCHELVYAERFFEGISQRSVGAWNAMIGGYVLNGCPLVSFFCLKKMQEDDKLTPDVITMINLLPACAQTGALRQGKSVQGFAIRRAFVSHFVFDTALIDMYGKCGRLNLAEILFSQMTSKSSISWNVMVAAYVHNKNYKKALELFQGFINTSWELDDVIIASILPAYAETASLREGEQIHSYVIKGDLVSNTYISNAIIYMYAKRGDIVSARKLFEILDEKDVVSWNTMIMAYALHGFGINALQSFNDMVSRGVQPNASTFVSLLTACSNSGMVEEGWKYFNLMKMEYGIDPGIEHYGCMIDLLGRRGNLKSALCFIDEMPLSPTSRIWGSLLNASRYSRNIEIAEYAAQHILSLDQDNTGCYVLLSNLYAKLERWENVERLDSMMKGKGLERATGCSVVEINGKVHSFVNHDQSHEEINKIYDALAIISSKIDEDIHVQSLIKFSPSKLTNCKSSSPAFHSVRIGIAFGLISTTVGKPILVRKNIRLCEDCHNAAKKISEITKREIVVGDSKIFHHFKYGKCSCEDYW